MEELVEYRYIFDLVQFRVPQKKDEYMTSFDDFDITFSFKNKKISKEKVDFLIAVLKSMKK